MGFVPLYQRLQEQIRADILEASAQNHGVKLPTERELQARYQVSRPTISKALAALAAEGLLVKAQGRGSFALSPPSESPEPAGRLPRRIGYVAPVTRAPLVQRAFHGIDRIAHCRDYSVLMGSAGNDVTRERGAIRELIASGARGLIIYPVPRTAEEARCDHLLLAPPEVPLVLIDTCLPEQGSTQVVFDNRRAGHTMTHWLLNKGHRRIGLLSYDTDIQHGPLKARLQGYHDALREQSIAPDPALLRRYHPLAQETTLSHCVDELLALAEPPTAIIAPEDVAAMDVIEHLLRRGVRVPEEIKVVGFDNREAGRRFRPSFTTSNPDFEHMGEIACGLLLDGLESGEMPPRTYVLEVPLLTRRVPDSLPGTALTMHDLATR